MERENGRNGLNKVQREVAPLKEALRNIAVKHARGEFCMEHAGMETKALVISFVLGYRDRLPERIPVGPNFVFDIVQLDLVPVRSKTTRKTPMPAWYQYSGLIASGIEHQMLPS